MRMLDSHIRHTPSPHPVVIVISLALFRLIPTNNILACNHNTGMFESTILSLNLGDTSFYVWIDIVSMGMKNNMDDDDVQR
jgi:hypothetical protein